MYTECVNVRWTRVLDQATLESEEKDLEMNGQNLDDLLLGKGKISFIKNV
jgi:hypothetical protein